MKNGKTLKWLLTLACLLAAVWAFTLVANAEIMASGYCGAEGDGSNLTWTLDDTGTLTISGKGEMDDSYTSMPWSESTDDAKRIIKAEVTNGVTKIGRCAFAGCTNLTSITIPDSVTIIENNAFDECESLNRVNIGSLSSWCSISFGYSNSNPLIYANRLFLNNKLLSNLVIPDDITIIEQYAFLNCSGITELTIPDTITNIGYDAFYGCTGIEKLTIGKLIEKHTIDDLCIPTDNLTTVVITDGTKSITNRAFNESKKLSEITIPDSIESIGTMAFFNCTKMTKVNITSLKSWCHISFYDFISNPLYYAQHLFLNGTEITTLDDFDVGEKIGDYVFVNCKSLTTIEIQNCATSIGELAFYNCTNVKEVTIPDSINSIEYGAFKDCNAIEKLTIGKTIEKYSLEEMSIPSNRIKTVIITNGPISIKSDAFYNCSALTDITIPKSVTKIGLFAFSNCGELERVNISSLTSWCQIVFDGVESNPLYYAHSLYQDNKEITDLIIPDGINIINDYAFCNGIDFTEVAIPDSVTNIGSSSFSGCKNIEKITVGKVIEKISLEDMGFPKDEISTVVIENGVTGIVDSAFSDCASLENITIPESIEYVGFSAFEDTPWLASQPDGIVFAGKVAIGFKGDIPSDFTLIIPNGTKAIGDGAFRFADWPEKIVLPNSLEKIGKDAFSSCLYVTSIIFPSSLTEIGEKAFYYCMNLTSIIIPNSLKSIGEAAFKECENLKDIYYTGSEAQWKNIVIEKRNLPITHTASIHYNYTPVTPGDVDGDGSITAADARLALRASVGLTEKGDVAKDSAGYLACDVDRDGKVTSADARLILRASVGLEDPEKWKQ